jgi:predicted component of type VI protein secretion system
VYRGIVYRVGAEGLTIGRDADGARRMLVVGDENSGVSRAHCEFVMRDGELKLRDISRYGTFVNETKVSGETTLQRADVIRVGSPGVELQAVSVEAAE